MKRLFPLPLLLASLALAACTSVPVEIAPEPVVPQPATVSAAKDETFTVDNLNISFTLPAEYWVYQTEGFEGTYITNLSFGERADAKSRHLTQAPLNISVLTGMNVGERTFGNPSEYIDYVLTEQKDSDALPVETTLFGNKAVTLTSAGDGTPTLVGHLRADQITDERFAQDYFVSVSAGTYGSGMTFDQELYDTVVQSLAVNDLK